MPLPAAERFRGTNLKNLQLRLSLPIDATRKKSKVEGRKSKGCDAQQDFDIDQ